MLNVINENPIFYSSQLLILVPRTTEIALISACFPKARVLAAAVRTGFIFKWMGKHVTKVSHSLAYNISLLVFSAPLCRVMVIANYSLATSKEIRNLKIFYCGIRNPGFWNPEFSSRNPESRIPSSTDKDTRIQYLESGTDSVESRIQDCLGIPYMGRIANQIC